MLLAGLVRCQGYEGTDCQHSYWCAMSAYDGTPYGRSYKQNDYVVTSVPQCMRAMMLRHTFY